MPWRHPERVNLSSHSEGMRFRWEPYTRDEIEAMARELGDPEDRPAASSDPRIPRLLATVLRGYADEAERRE